MLIGLSMLLGGAAAVQAYIMGPDDRVAPSADEQRQDAVRQTGIIRIPGEDFVSGLVIGANCDVVLSAGHAAYHYASDELRGIVKGTRRGAGNPSFFLNPLDPSSGITMELIRSGYDDPARVGLDESDWAVFRLAEPAQAHCADFGLSLPARACSGTVSLPAYHFDRRDTLLLDRACRAQPAPLSTLIVHDCDTKAGSSGAPMICNEPGGASVIGVNVSGLTDRRYYDPGVFGEGGPQFDKVRHKNYAVAVTGPFRSAVQAELRASAQRFAARTQPAPAAGYVGTAASRDQD